MSDLLEDLLERHPRLREVADRERAHVRELMAETEHGYREGLRTALELVATFHASYPLDVFPWPQESPSSDAIAARMGRHVCDRLAEQLREAIDTDEGSQ